MEVAPHSSSHSAGLSQNSDLHDHHVLRAALTHQDYAFAAVLSSLLEGESQWHVCVIRTLLHVLLIAIFGLIPDCQRP